MRKLLSSLSLLSPFTLAKFTTLDLMNRLPSVIVRPLHEIYNDALDHYNNQEWEQAANLFEQSLVSYKLRTTLESNCRNRCEESPLKYAIDRNIKEFDHFNVGMIRMTDLLNEMPNDENTAYGELMERVICLRTCRAEHPFYAILEHDRKYPVAWIIDDFKLRKPYDYLQFVYFKLEKHNKACQAALTFYNAKIEGGKGPSEQAQKNLKWFLTPESEGGAGVKMNECYDLEMSGYAIDFDHAVTFYEGQEYTEAIKLFNTALENYYTTFDECISLCSPDIGNYYLEKGYIAFDDLNLEAFKFFKQVYECKKDCRIRMQVIVQDTLITNLPKKAYDYLQFAQYQVKDISMAAQSAASAVLLDETDETNGETSSNDKRTQSAVEFYKKYVQKCKEADKEECKDIEVTPFTKAKKYHRTIQAINILNDKINDVWESGVDDSGEEEVPVDPNAPKEENNNDDNNSGEAAIDLVINTIREAKRVFKIESLQKDINKQAGEVVWNAKDKHDEEVGEVKHKLPSRKKKQHAEA